MYVFREYLVRGQCAPCIDIRETGEFRPNTDPEYVREIVARMNADPEFVRRNFAK